jgi:large subunit ribosomal protein L31
MKEGIHPEYPPAAVNCACGNSFVTRSTRGDFQVDVCSNCHPFYTGTQKLMDAAGRVGEADLPGSAVIVVLGRKCGPPSPLPPPRAICARRLISM